ncbi:DUF3558 family protein [Amycolatopsis orientalis]|uniref:DUF3558 family protein n=1 Tax=Amycolatopsis orientalis TaxID=31958 RepID=UPI0003A625BC|nr:DUF3558 family protein [Amycolatopsis orientalis]
MLESVAPKKIVPPHRRRRAGLLLAFLLGAAGCSSAPPPPPRLSPPLPDAPLDLAQFTTKPCDLMAHDQLVMFFVSSPGTTAPVAGKTACTWIPHDTKALAYTASVDTTSGGLEARYRRRASIPGFAPVFVHSYPGIHRDTRDGQCTVETGVADDTLLTVTVTATDPKLDAYNDPCYEADRFAGIMIAYQANRAP